jgi:hypothetical protein
VTVAHLSFRLAEESHLLVRAHLSVQIPARRLENQLGKMPSTPSGIRPSPPVHLPLVACRGAWRWVEEWLVVAKQVDQRAF